MSWAFRQLEGAAVDFGVVKDWVRAEVLKGLFEDVGHCGDV